jgi:hypothetical protein
MAEDRKFPVLTVTGTHRDLGAAIGETYRDRIAATIAKKKGTNPQYTALIPYIGEFIAATDKAFPDLIVELTAVADAAGVTFEDIFFHNIGSISDPDAKFDREQSQTLDHCTIAVSWDTNGNPIVGHNEDWDMESIDELYILKATIGDTTFMGLNYATFLPGVSASFNSHGLVQCINEIPQYRMSGVPKNFIARSMLEATTLDECVNTVKTTKHASGYNHMLLQDGEIRDIEIGGTAIDVEQVLSGTPYAHTNHFISRKLQKYELHSYQHHENSYARYDRARELLTVPMTVDGMAALLSDRTNTQYPISRHDATIGSAIITPADGTIRICYGPPDQGTYVSYTL